MMLVIWLVVSFIATVLQRQCNSVAAFAQYVFSWKGSSKL